MRVCNEERSFSRTVRSRHNKSVTIYSIVVIILAAALTASFYGGFPRQGSMGPYRGDLRFPSDYDFEAINFIEHDVAQTNQTFLVLGDAASSAAALQMMGYRVIASTIGKVISIYPFEWGISLPTPQNPNSFESLDYAMDQTKAGIIYIILTYRLNASLQRTVDAYTSMFGAPLFKLEGKAYVFKYVQYSETDPVLIADDGQASSRFWSVERFGQGQYDVSLRDDNISRISGNDSLNIAIVNGIYQRFTLQHFYDVPQDWSNKDLLVMWLNGNSSGWNFNIVFRSFTVNDYYTYASTDDFSGWKRLIVPLNSFTATGSPSWSR